MSNHPARLRVRILEIALGVALLIWLPFEDTSTRLSLLMAIPAAALMGYHVLRAFHGQTLLSFVGAGLFSGISVTPIAAGFMLVKIGLHSHGNTADFTFEDFSQVFDRTLFLGAAGLCIGAGLKLFFFSD